MKRRVPGLPPAIQHLLHDCPCQNLSCNGLFCSALIRYQHPHRQRFKNLIAVRQELHRQLMQMDFQAFQMLMQRLLSDMGYTSVAVGRRHWKGRTRRGNGSGGCDVLLSAQTGVTKGLVVVQLKHYTRPVQRRFVDELRGTMLRLGARYGLLITTSTFPSGTQEAAMQDGVAPVRLIDGEAMLNLCFVHQLGVRQVGPTNSDTANEHQHNWQLDTALFERLAQAVHEKQLQDLTLFPPSKRRKVCHNGGLSPVGVAAIGAGSRMRRTTVPVWQQITPARPDDANKDDADEANNTHNTTKDKNSGGEMTWTTHIMAGFGSLWLLSLMPHGVTPENLSLVAAGTALGALLPDLDAAESKIKHLRIAGTKPFAPVAVSLWRGLGHRGLMHSLLGLTIAATAPLLLSPWLSWPVSLALILGYGSHLATDALTRSGIPWLYPHKQRYHLLPPRLRFVTGSHAEAVLLPFLVLLFGLLLLRLLATIVAA